MSVISGTVKSFLLDSRSIPVECRSFRVDFKSFWVEVRSLLVDPIVYFSNFGGFWVNSG